jgi:hypothetical protein
MERAHLVGFHVYVEDGEVGVSKKRSKTITALDAARAVRVGELRLESVPQFK